MRIYSTTRASIVIGAQRHFGKALCEPFAQYSQFSFPDITNPPHNFIGPSTIRNHLLSCPRRQTRPQLQIPLVSELSSKLR